MDLKIRKAGNITSDLCEWNPGNGKWYPIHRTNMQIKGPPQGQCNLFNALLVGLIVGIKGSYDRTKKQLTLKL